MKKIIFKIKFTILFIFIFQFSVFSQKFSKISITSNKIFIIKPNKSLWASGSDIQLANLNNSLIFNQIDNNAYNEVTHNYQNVFVIKNDSTIWVCGASNNKFDQI